MNTDAPCNLNPSAPHKNITAPANTTNKTTTNSSYSQIYSNLCTLDYKKIIEIVTSVVKGAPCPDQECQNIFNKLQNIAKINPSSTCHYPLIITQALALAYIYSNGSNAFINNAFNTDSFKCWLNIQSVYNNGSINMNKINIRNINNTYLEQGNIKFPEDNNHFHTVPMVQETRIILNKSGIQGEIYTTANRTGNSEKRAIIYYKDKGLLYIGSVNNEHQPSDTGSIVSKHKNITTGMWKEGKLLGKYVEIQYADSNANNKYQGEYARGKPNGMGTLTSRDGSIYTGYFVDGMQHGKGSYTDRNKNKITGTWNNDKLTTEAVEIRFITGDIYTGQHQDGTPHGNGFIKYSHGSSHAGNFTNGILHGKGSYMSKDGDKITGVWNNGELTTADVKVHFITGDIYRGQHKNGVAHGEGIAEYSNGSRYKGAFVNGIRHGQGKHTDINKNIISGEWNNNNLESTATINIVYYSTKKVYSGSHQNGIPHGDGVIKYADGSSHEGNFVNGSLCGKGSYTDKKGNKVSGTWENGKITTAKIVTQYADGKVYEGEHDETGNPHGQGVLKDSDGVRSYQGTFEHGALRGHGSYTDENGNTTSGIYEGDSVVAKLLDITIFSEVLLMPAAA
ncbi:MAG: hypothetical protein QG673_1755 [Pseudomonadota bacterium]|nr:hypothetical protein [Pseudomonadota bacterium]